MSGLVLTDMKQIVRDGLIFVLCFSFMFSVSCPSRLLLLSPPHKLSVSLLHTRKPLSSHCIYNPASPSRPRPRCDWRADVDEPAQYAAFPILFTFPSGNQFRRSQKNLSAHLWADYTVYAHNYAGWHTHALTSRKSVTLLGTLQCFLLLFFLPSCSL